MAFPSALCEQMTQLSDQRSRCESVHAQRKVQEFADDFGGRLSLEVFVFKQTIRGFGRSVFQILITFFRNSIRVMDAIRVHPAQSAREISQRSASNAR